MHRLRRGDGGTGRRQEGPWWVSAKSRRSPVGRGSRRPVRSLARQGVPCTCYSSPWTACIKGRWARLWASIRG